MSPSTAPSNCTSRCGSFFARLPTKGSPLMKAGECSAGPWPSSMNLVRRFLLPARHLHRRDAPEQLADISMKKFQFKLQAVLTLRQREEQVALEGYSRALQSRQAAAERLAEIERDLSESRRQW